MNIINIFNPMDKNNKSSVLLLAIIFIMFASLLLGGVLLYISSDNRLAERQNTITTALYMAEAGTEKALSDIIKKFSRGYTFAQVISGNLPPVFNEPPLDQYSYTDFSINTVGSPVIEKISKGMWKGLNALIQKIRIRVKAENNTTGASATIIEEVYPELIPIFQFAVFYDGTAEIQPGPTMSISGRCHINGDLYTGCDGTLSYNYFVTVTGNIINTALADGVDGVNHRRLDGTQPELAGTVNIKDLNQSPAYGWTDSDSDSYDDDQNFGQTRTLSHDSLYSDWETWSWGIWGDGNVKEISKVMTGVHGVEELNLPLPLANNNIDIIKRPLAGDSTELTNARFFNKAGIRIYYDTSTSQYVTKNITGNTIDLAHDISNNPITVFTTNKTFWNTREQKTIKILEVDISKLQIARDWAANNNGIVYISNAVTGAGLENGVRLINGQSLPVGGLTVVSDNPVYIKGNYNSTSPHQPAAVISDALGIVSSSWDDSQHTTSTSQTNATAGTTEVNSCFMTGIVPTVLGGFYSGGFENLPRFFENWSGCTLKWRGSAVVIWNSEQGTGAWHYGTWNGKYYYGAPTRDWGFDIMYLDPAKLPPGTPYVCAVQKIQWLQD